MTDTSRLRRELQPMPDDVRVALEQGGLDKAYKTRPAYQRNDYVAWIGRAKRDSTRSKRLNQMFDELARGGVYMGMEHKPSAQSASTSSRSRRTL